MMHHVSVFCCRDNVPVRNKAWERKVYLSFMASKVAVHCGLGAWPLCLRQSRNTMVGELAKPWGCVGTRVWPSKSHLQEPALLPPSRVTPSSSPFSYELMKLWLSRSEHPNTTVLRSVSSTHKSFKEHFFKCAPWFLNSRGLLCSLCLVSLGHRTHSFRFLLSKMHCDLCYGSTNAWLWCF